MVESLLVDYIPYILVVVASMGLPILFFEVPISIRILWGLTGYAVPQPGDEGSNEGATGAVPLTARNRKKKEKQALEAAGLKIYSIPFGAATVHDLPFYQKLEEVTSSGSFAICSLLCCEILRYAWPNNQGQLVPTVFGVLGVAASLRSLGYLQIERSAFMRQENFRLLAAAMVGLVTSMGILTLLPEGWTDFQLDEACKEAGRVFTAFMKKRGNDQTYTVPAYGVKLVLSICGGLLSGLIYPAAVRFTRCLHLATTKPSWDIGVFDHHPFANFILRLSVVVPLFTVLLWVKPMADIFVALPPLPLQAGGNTTPAEVEEGPLAIRLLGILLPRNDDWLREYGMASSSLATMRLICLLASGLLQIGVFRLVIQGYLNWGLILWWEYVNSSVEPPNLEAVRKRLVYINLFSCKIALQCLAPGILTLSFLGLSRAAWGNSEEVKDPHNSLVAPLFLQAVGVFLSWWCLCVWVVSSCTHLALYRVGLVRTI